MTPTELTIRKARAEDYDAACRLFDELDALHRDRLPWLFRAPMGTPRSEEFFAQLLSGDESALWVAEAASIVGIAHAALHSAPELAVFVPQRWGVLDNLVVHPAWRRRGIGSLLVQAIEEWAFSQGASCVQLGVYEFNAEARRFYEALGYLPLRTVVRKARQGV